VVGVADQHGGPSATDVDLLDSFHARHVHRTK